MMICESTGKTLNRSGQLQEAQATVGVKRIVRQGRVQGAFSVYG